MTTPTPSFLLRAAGVLLGGSLALAAVADTGKLVLTGGVSGVDGTAGGGIVPWAVIGTQATEGEFGFSGFATRLSTRDYGLTAAGAAVAWNDRMEVSIARQDLNAAPAPALNGVADFGVLPEPHLRLDIVGVKVRLLGEAILDADHWLPQVSVGVQHKSLSAGSLQSVVDFLGARNSGTDVYVSATKLFLGTGLLVNGTLRYTNANQNGLVGFGAAAPGRDRRSLVPEISVAYLLRRDLAIGAEYRFMPNNLEALGRAAGLDNGLVQDDWRDIFIAWAPHRNVSLTLARVDLGRVVPGVTASRRQTGNYLSVQVAY